MIDDDVFPLSALGLGALIVMVACFAPSGEGRTAAIALGSNLTGIGGASYQIKVKYGGRDDD